MEKRLKENEVLIGGKAYLIKPVKMKYIKNGFLWRYSALSKDNLVKILKFSDGEQFILDFMTAILDDEELAKESAEELDNQTVKEILLLTTKLNELEPEVPNETIPKEQA